MSLPRRAGVAFALVCAAVLAGCGAHGSFRGAASEPDVLATRERIKQAWLHMREISVDGGLIDVPPRRGPPCLRPAAIPAQCQDRCSIGTVLCDRTELVCRLARQLSPDSYADGKCRVARATCRSHSDACCVCAGALRLDTERYRIPCGTGRIDL